MLVAECLEAVQRDLDALVNETKGADAPKN
jgi:hypothetical protein